MDVSNRTAPTFQRILRIALLLWIGGSAAAAILHPPLSTGVFAGGGLALLVVVLWQWMAPLLVERGPRRAVRGLYLVQAVKIPLLVALVALAVAHPAVHPLGLLAGLSVVVAATSIEVVWSLLRVRGETWQV